MHFSFLMPVKSQPRYQKRINAIRNHGAEVKGYYFEREYFDGKPLEFENECIGRFSHGQYFKRLLILVFVGFKLRRKIPEDSQVMYCFDLSMVFLGLLCKKKHQLIVYEVADIRPLMSGKKIRSKFARWFERYLLQFVSHVVVTSPKFITGYFGSIQGIKRENFFSVLENKLPTDLSLPVKPMFMSNKIRIGYFGLLRCEKTLLILGQLLKEYPGQFEIKVYGRFTVDHEKIDEFLALPDVGYFGEYVWPTDLPSMYSSVDIVWACYPYDSITPGNWQWAMTNRYYESCYFSKPMIVMDDSGDNNQVIRYKIGLSYDLSSASITQQIAKDLTQEKIASITANYRNLPKSAYMFSTEHSEFVQRIRSLSKFKSNSISNKSVD